MSLIAVGSVKGSPGATTVACLLGATWPDSNPPIVGECDSCGGDLAARFSLSARVGWPSLVSSTRRDVPPFTLTDHLQTLPGGVRVLVGDRETAMSGSSSALLFAHDGMRFSDGPWGLIADLGRFAPNSRSTSQWPWLEAAACILICLQPDTSSAVHVKEWLQNQPDVARARAWLVVVDRVPGRPTEELERFVGAPVAARMPQDDVVARALRGEPAPAGRLRRSSLIRSAAALAERLSSMPSEDIPSPNVSSNNGRSGASMAGGDAEHHDAPLGHPIGQALSRTLNGLARRSP